MIDRIVTVEIVLAAVFALGFVVAYLIARPWRTVAGRLVLAFMGSLGLLLTLAMIRVFTGHDTTWWIWVRLASWSLIMSIFAGALIAQVVTLVRRDTR